MFNNFQQRLRSFRLWGVYTYRAWDSFFAPDLKFNAQKNRTDFSIRFCPHLTLTWAPPKQGTKPITPTERNNSGPKRSSICRRKLRKEISIALIKQFITACWMEETFPISTFFFRSLFHFHLDVTAEFVSQHQRNKKKKKSEKEEEKSILQNVTSRRRSFAEAVARSILIFCSLPVW